MSSDLNPAPEPYPAVPLQATDMSSARAWLLASIPGYHAGRETLHKYGHMQLRARLSQVGGGGGEGRWRAGSTRIWQQS